MWSRTTQTESAVLLPVYFWTDGPHTTIPGPPQRSLAVISRGGFLRESSKRGQKANPDTPADPTHSLVFLNREQVSGYLAFCPLNFLMEALNKKGLILRYVSKSWNLFNFTPSQKLHRIWQFKKKYDGCESWNE